MGKWKMVDLVTACDLNMGQSPESSSYNQDGNGIPFYQGNADFGELYPKTRYFCSQPNKIANKDDILLSVRAPIGALNIATETCCIGRGLAALTARENLTDKKFLYYVLKHKNAELNQKGTGSTFKAINKQNLSNVQFPLPPLETQKKIAKTLDTATELLTMYKQQLAELDNLIKSIFYDMFGDPVANEKGWALKPIGDFSMVKIGPFGSLLHAEDYIEGGFPLVNPSHIIDGKIVPDMKLTLSTKKFKELKSYAMKKGDIVVGRRGEIGRCAIVDDEGFLCGTGSMYIRIKKDYLPMMLQRIISSETIRAKLEHQSVGVTMKNLNAGTISNLEIPMPPLPLQNQFASIVTKIEAQKALVKKAIDETQYLFDCLMSEYFE